MELPIIVMLGGVIERIVTVFKPGIKQALTTLGQISLLKGFANEDFQKLVTRLVSLVLGFILASGTMLFTDPFVGTMLESSTLQYKILVFGILLGLASNGVHWSLQNGDDLAKALINYIVGKSEVEQQRAQAIKQQALPPTRNVPLGQ